MYFQVLTYGHAMKKWGSNWHKNLSFKSNTKPKNFQIDKSFDLTKNLAKNQYTNTSPLQGSWLIT